MTVEFMGTLDNNVRTVQGKAMDVLAGYTVAGLAPFTAGSAEEAMAADPTSVALGTLGVAVKVGRVRPNLVDQLQDATVLLLNAGGTAAEVARINSALGMFNTMQSLSLTTAAAETPATASGYSESQYPLSTFYQTVVKNAVSGLSMQANPDEMYDTVLRQRVVAFKKTVKVKSKSVSRK